jgi:hypothetical protein
VSLSNPRVIDTLNRYFVPVYLSNEDYAPNGAASAEEKKERQRIFLEGHERKLSVGSVHAYVLSPDGSLLDTRHVAKAGRTDEMLALLDGAVQTLGTQPGKPLAPAAAQSTAVCRPGNLTLHLTARYLRKVAKGYALVEGSGGNWDAIPGEDWIELDRARWSKLIPPGKVSTGSEWDLDPEISASILRYFYPPTENNNVAKDRLEESGLHATVQSVQAGVARAALTGGVKLQHSFYHKPDGKVARAEVVGVLEYETGGARRLRSLRLATDNATYGAEGAAGTPFGVAVRTVCAP